MYERHILGRNGEKVAADYLRKLGYTIIAKNFVCKQGEIDIIAQDGEYIVFIEIKSRSNSNYGLPSEAVTEKKIKHILKTAQFFLYINGLEQANVRIDAIEVYIKHNKYVINHLKQII